MVFKRVRLLLAVGVLGTLWPIQCVHGAGWTPPAEGAAWGRFAAGMAAGVAIHELGHVAVATAQGNRVAFHGPSLTYPGAVLSRSQRLQVSSAGFQAQWLAAEGVLQFHEAQGPDHRIGHFSAGVVAAHLAITGAYVLVLKDHEHGDISGASQGSGIPRDKLLLMVSVPALLDAWRLLGDRVPRWVSHLSLATKGTGLVLIWSR